MASIHDWNLIEWRREILDENIAEDGDAIGPGAECSAQTVMHRLNGLSKLIQTWARAHKVKLDNPVKPGDAPANPMDANGAYRKKKKSSFESRAELVTRMAVTSDHHFY